MSTKLRILIDECVQGPLAAAIRSHSGLMKCEVIDAKHPLGNQGTSDDQVLAYATEHQFITVTYEWRFDQKRYKICTHPGIIRVLTENKHHAIQFRAFEELMKSGKRHLCKHAIVTLHDDHFTVRRLVKGSPQSTTHPYAKSVPGSRQSFSSGGR